MVEVSFVDQRTPRLSWGVKIDGTRNALKSVPGQYTYIGAKRRHAQGARLALSSRAVVSGAVSGACEIYRTSCTQLYSRGA